MVSEYLELPLDDSGYVDVGKLSPDITQEEVEQAIKDNISTLKKIIWLKTIELSKLDRRVSNLEYGLRTVWLHWKGS